MVNEMELLEERYPRIHDMIKYSWGSKECASILDDLILPNREGREGFGFDVLVALTTITEEHKKRFPNLYPKKDIWHMQD